MSNKAKILCVDDDPQTLIILREVFKAKYQVLTASNGAEALDIIQRERVHAILSDQLMPNMLGHELLQEVKKISPFTMRILLTAYSDMSAIMNSINEGEVFRFVIKPWQAAELRVIVDSAVEIAEHTMDSMAEPAIPATAIEALPRPQSHGMLILDDDQETQNIFAQRYGKKYALYAASSIAEALDILVAQDIDLLIIDTSINDEIDAADFIMLLKEQYPQIITIVQTSMITPDRAVKLINHGQIYRYLNKPVKESLMDSSIKQALMAVDKNKEKPELLERHRVESSKDSHNVTLSAKIAGRLRTLRSRLS
ncbi:MAG: response regulator [Gammaproteobacteria bacterium]